MQPDPTLSIIGLCLTAISVLVSVGIATTTLIVSGKREHEKWMKEQRIAAFYDFLDKVDAFEYAFAATSGRASDDLAQGIADEFDKVHSERIKAVCNQRTRECADLVEQRMREQINHQFKKVANISDEGVWTGPFVGTSAAHYPPVSTTRARKRQFLLAVDDLREAVGDENNIDRNPSSFWARLAAAWAVIRGSQNTESAPKSEV